MRYLAFCLFVMIGWAKPGTRGAVEGRVYLPDGRRPATGASVFLLPQLRPSHGLPSEFIARDDDPQRGQFHAVVDAAGRARIVDVKPGVYYVIAQLPGCISAEDYVLPGSLAAATRPRFVQKVVVRKARLAHFKIRLERGGSIAGRVLSGGGGPLEGAGLTLLIRRRDGSFGDAFVGARHTDRNGQYSFAGLPPARYIVRAGLASERPHASGPMLFFGNAARASQAHVIEVSGTETQSGIDITFPTAGVHLLSGKVELPGGMPVLNGFVRLSAGGESASSRANAVQADGTFAFDRVGDGDYTLTVEDPPVFEPMGLTADGKGVRVRQRKPRYAVALQSIKVAGRDIVDVRLRPAGL